MTPTEQKKAAQEFVNRWKLAEGNEDRESDKYWIELYGNVLGVSNPTYYLDFQRHARGKRMDVFIEDMGVLIENKSRGVDLDKPELRGKDRYGNPRLVTPFEQAKWYADNITPRSIAPKWIVTCNFDEMRIYDLDEEKPESCYETILLTELPDLLHRFSFMTRKENSRAEREKKLSVEAGVIVGKLYDALSKQYLHIETNPVEQASLNILITRIVFLLYAEDAELLQEKDAFYKYLKAFSAEQTAGALHELFRVLKTPLERRDPYAAQSALAFPYINGGLFEQDIVIPQFTFDARFTLLQEASAEFDWAGISPTIFGAVFESTLNPETRRAGGMHYTSVENIHKVTGPLFYDALKDELTTIEGLKVEKEKKFKLRAFRKKLSSIKVLDPACGSGNFLTETYLSLRKLENRVLEDLHGHQMVMFDADDLISVSINQFYGIEINGFAVEVAKTALWIAELQMLDQTREITETWIEPLPLKTNENIHCSNALRMDWSNVIPAEKCSYIIGNPPFGNSVLTNDQKQERADIFDKQGGLLDYVACWYKKAADYIGDSPIRCAFVSTNSICQGQQVAPLWNSLFKSGIQIDFAYRTFVWNSEALDQAHVFCIIVGFSRVGSPKKSIFTGEDVLVAHNINGYLRDAPNVAVESRTKPLCDVPKMLKGIQPTDHGYLVLSPKEKDDLIKKEPQTASWILPFIAAKELIDGKERYCLWLEGATPSDLDEMPLVKQRVEQCRKWRESQTKTGDAYKLRDKPHLMRPSSKFHLCDYIVIPRHTGERRLYVPMAFMRGDTIPADSSSFVPDATYYQFGILTSRFHMAWMRAVAGRLKGDYRYTSDIVYNNFVWPDPTDEQRASIEAYAQAVLDIRASHPGKSLADLYDPDKMPTNLLMVHKALDAAVEAAYRVNFDGDEEKIIAHLFKLYAEKKGD